MEAANQISDIPQDYLNTSMVNWLEGFYGVRYHVLIRFGKFD